MHEIQLKKKVHEIRTGRETKAQRKLLCENHHTPNIQMNNWWNIILWVSGTRERERERSCLSYLCLYHQLKFPLYHNHSAPYLQKSRLSNEPKGIINNYEGTKHGFSLKLIILEWKNVAVDTNVHLGHVLPLWILRVLRH